MKPWEFWELTWPDYHRLAEGFYKRQELEWERIRFLGALIFNANSQHPKSPQELVPLNLDKQRRKSGSKGTSKEEAERIAEKYKNRFKPKLTNGGE